MHMSRKTEMEQGYVNSWMIVAISAIVLFVAAGSAAIWAYLAYSQEKTAVKSNQRLTVRNLMKKPKTRALNLSAPSSTAACRLCTQRPGVFT